MVRVPDELYLSVIATQLQTLPRTKKGMSRQHGVRLKKAGIEYDNVRLATPIPATPVAKQNAAYLKQ